jgi:hypothetical protein
MSVFWGRPSSAQALQDVLGREGLVNLCLPLGSQPTSEVCEKTSVLGTG